LISWVNNKVIEVVGKLEFLCRVTEVVTSRWRSGAA
jgi:hypothetical protein